MAKKKNINAKVESIRHKDKRANIPTKELRDFVADEELSPKSIVYPRDSTLDPQLVWKGKDEQDRQKLVVSAVPLYIQEKIHPQAIINDLQRIEQPEDSQFMLFSDFNGGPHDFDQKIDFYHHEQNWTNRLILGDSLLVMSSLAEKEGLKGKIQTIYIDPPYGINFASNWQVSTRKKDVKDGKAEDATRQPEQVRAFRDTWKLGIHSYLAYLRDRLVVSRDLLTETGSIFVQIGDENVHLVRCLLEEVFGSDNFVSQITLKRASVMFTKKHLKSDVYYVIWFAKDINLLKYRQLFKNQSLQEFANSSGSHLWFEENKKCFKSTPEQRNDIQKFLNENPSMIPFSTLGLNAQGTEKQAPFAFQGKQYYPPKGTQWKTSYEGLQKLADIERLIIEGNNIRYKYYYSDYPVSELGNYWESIGAPGEKIYVVQTSEEINKRCILMTTDPGDLVFDPTCGSGTTAFVAEQWGRRWITCDTSRVALALARTRLMSAKFPYYLLADSPEGIKKEMDITGKVLPEYNATYDIKKGFVYKCVRHITLGSIANNPDIKKGMTHKQINVAISRHVDMETLYDQPYEDIKRVRVCGPFSVESLSPHRLLSTSDDTNSPLTEQEARKQHDFVTMILENLKRAGVQNTLKKERLNFVWLDPYPGVWLHGSGEYIDNEGKSRRVAVSIGPEHGTVGPQQVKEAVKEAVQGLGFDVLVICGFARDPHVAEEVKRYGKLKITVLYCQMNPDLAMGDELLKKTKEGNLFMVFGEPDIEIKTQKNDMTVLKINGIDVYDPTTGVIRSSSTDDIACWFIDTNYNGESFFVRHAYFTGAGEPYEKLKRALKSQVNEEIWSSIYSTVSRPFNNPKTGKIAVKVINHYGDEVLKVFEVPSNELPQRKSIRITNAAHSIKKTKERKNTKSQKKCKSPKKR